MSPFLTVLLVNLLGLFSEILNILELVVVVAVILSWLISFDIINLRNRTAYQIVSMLQNVNDRLLYPIRRFVPPIAGLDFSPLIFLFLCRVIQQVLIRALIVQISAMGSGV